MIDGLLEARKELELMAGIVESLDSSAQGLCEVKKKEEKTDKVVKTRSHEPKPLPRDSRIVKKGKKFGIDSVSRHVYEFNGFLWSWDRQEGEWEVFDSVTRIHLRVMNAIVTKKVKDAKPGRKLTMKGGK